jgi:uncharacterized protein YkwD
MLRVVLALCLSFAVAGCSVGHISMPFTLPAAAPADKSGTAPPPKTWRGATGLGGPDAAASIAAAAAQQPLASPGALDLINELRHGKGLAPLTHSAELTRAAQMQAANLARTGALTHIGNDGSTPLDRVRRTGYKPRMAAENIAGGQTTVVDAIRSWRESDSHLHNLLLRDATQMGIAQVNDPRSGMRTYWTLVLAAPL